jgi:hypothetical protein
MNPIPNESRETPEAPAQTWRPAFEVISLACELSAYAPDDGGPLF